MNMLTFYVILSRMDGTDRGFVNLDTGEYVDLTEATLFDSEEVALKTLLSAEELEPGEEEFVLEYEVHLKRVLGSTR